jgi:hypothetical protein
MKKIIGMIRHPKQWLAVAQSGRESGMATAEYAVGTVAVVSLGSLIWKIISSDQFRDAIWSVIKWIFQLITGIGSGS